MADTPRLMPQEMSDDDLSQISLPESAFVDGQVENHNLPASPSFAQGHPNPLESCPPATPATPQYDWDLPGVETAPVVNSARQITGHWMAGEFLLLHVGYVSFQVPVSLLAKYPFWASICFSEQPPQGWSMPEINADIFAVLMESVYSTSGLQGIEGGLNLVKISYAFVLAWRWSMTEEQIKLRDTANRYVVRKVLHHSPHHPRSRKKAKFDHFVYRSEELYRAWEISRRYPCLQYILNQRELVSLYAVIIPMEYWSLLSEHFSYDFRTMIEVAAAARQGPDEVNFQHWWLHFFRLSGYTEAGWMDRGTRDRIFGRLNEYEDGSSMPMGDAREFAASRAHSDALIHEQDVHLQQEEYLAGEDGGVDLDEYADTEGDILIEDDFDAEGDILVKGDVDAGPGPGESSTISSQLPRVRHANRVRFSDEEDVFTFHDESYDYEEDYGFDNILIPYEDIPEETVASGTPEEAQIMEDDHFEAQGQ